MNEKTKSSLRRFLLFVVFFNGVLSLFRAISPTGSAHDPLRFAVATIVATALIFLGVARNRI